MNEDVKAGKSRTAGGRSSEHRENGEHREDGGAGSFFDNIDPEALMKIMEMAEMFNDGGNCGMTGLLNALKPLLRDENRGYADEAIRIAQLLTLLPKLRESGLLNF